MRGKTKWWSHLGYGGILGDDGVEYFVHYSAIEKQSGERIDLEVGQVLEFNAVQGARGPRAENVKATR